MARAYPRRPVGPVAGVRDGGLEQLDLAQPRRVRGAAVVVLGDDALRPLQQAGIGASSSPRLGGEADRAHAAAAGGRTARRNAPRRGCAWPAPTRAGRPPRRDAPQIGQHVQAQGAPDDREAPKAVAAALVEQVVRATRGVGEAGRRRDVAHADQRDLHCELLDDGRQPAAGRPGAGAGWRRAGRGRRSGPPAATTRASNSSTSGPSSGCDVRGTGSGGSRRTVSCGSAGHRGRRAQQPEDGGVLDEVVTSARRDRRCCRRRRARAARPARRGRA